MYVCLSNDKGSKTIKFYIGWVFLDTTVKITIENAKKSALLYRSIK